MANYYFSKTWVGLENGTVVNVVGGGTATIGTDAFADSYDAYMAGVATGGTYGDDWVIKTCDVYVDCAYASYGAGDPINLTVVNPDDPTETYVVTGVFTMGTDAFGVADTSTAANCKAVLNSARNAVTANGVGAIVITDINGDSTYAFGSLTSTNGFFANGKPIVIDGGTITGSSTGSPISGGANGSSPSVTSVTINAGYVQKLWGAGVNSNVTESNVIINGGSVYTLFGGGYSGTVTNVNVFYYGGHAGNIYSNNGATVQNVNFTVKGVTSTGNLVVAGAASAQASKVTGDVNISIIDSSLSRGLTGNHGGAMDFSSLYVHIINSSAGTIGLRNAYVTNGGGVSASVYSYVIHVDGGTLGEADGTGVTMKDLGDETYNQRTLKVTAGSTGADSRVSKVVDIDALLIDADACLTVTTLTASGASLTVDATGYHGADKTVLIANTRPTGEYTVLENGTVSSRYYLAFTGGTVSLKVIPAYFTSLWAGLEAGTVVAAPGGTAIIGTNAFATYEEAAASGMTPQSLDYYVNSDWTTGTAVTIEGQAGTFTQIVADAVTSESVAYNDFAAARSAKASNADNYGMMNVVGGTYGGIYMNNPYYAADGTAMAGMNVANAEFGSSNIRGYYNNNAVVQDINLNLSNINQTGGTIFGMDVVNIATGNRITGVINIDITGSTVSQILGLGSNNDSSSSTNELTLSIDINLVDTYASGSVFFAGRGTGSTTVINTTGYSRLSMVNSSISSVSESAWSEKAQFNYQAGRTYHLDNSRVRGTITIDNASDNNIVLLNASTIGTVALTTTYGDCGDLSISVGGSGESRINSAFSLRSGDTLDIAAADADIFVNGAFVNDGTITINTDDLVFSGGDTQKLVFRATSLTNNGSISLTGEHASEYSISIYGGSIYVKAPVAYFSAGWADLSEGDVVAVDGGTAIIGTSAFVTYAEAAATVAEGTIIKTGDIYGNSLWTDGDTVSVYGYTTTVNDSDAFNDFVTARNNYTNRLADDGVLYFVGGTYNDGSQAGPSQTQLLNGIKTIMRDVEATTIIAGWTGGSGRTNTDLTVIDSLITDRIYGGNRANSVITDEILLKVSGSTVRYIGYAGLGLGTSEAYATADVIVTGSTIGGLGPNSNVYGDVTVTIIDSTIGIVGGAGASDSNRSYGTMTFNLVNSNITKAYFARGVDANNGSKNGYVLGDLVINVSGGTSWLGSVSQIASTQANSVTINIAADSLLSSNASIADYVNININVDGYSGTGSKLVLTGQDVSSNTITVTGENASKYTYSIDGTNLYVVRNPDAYFSIGWSDLDEGEVVTTPIGTAIIGTDAFATYDEAVAAVGDLVSPTDVYFNYDWVGTTTAGDIVDVTTPGGTFTAEIGNGAYNTLSSALNHASNYGYVHFVGGTYATSAATDRTGLDQKSVWFTNTRIAGDGALCGVSAYGNTVSNAVADVVIGEGARIGIYYASRSRLIDSNVMITVRDGGYVASLYGCCTSETFIGGTTTINVIDGGTAGSIWGGGSGVNTVDTYINVIDSTVNGNIIGAGPTTASSNIGSIFITIDNSTVGGSVRSNNTGNMDLTGGTLSIHVSDSTMADITLNGSAAKIVNNGTVDINVSNSTMGQFVGVAGGGDDVTVNLSGATVNVASMQPIVSGNYGALNVSVTDDSVFSRYFYVTGGTVASADVVISDSEIGLIDTEGGFQFASGAAAMVEGDINYTFSNVTARYIYTANNGSIGGDLTVTFNGGSMSEYRVATGGVVANGSKTVTFASGTTTIANFNATYSAYADVTVSAGATLSVGNGTFAYNSFTLNGELLLTSDDVVTSISANGFFDVTANASGSGSVSVDGLSTLSDIDSTGMLYVYLTEQPVIYVNSEWSDYVTNKTEFIYQGKYLRGGVSAFTTVDAAQAFAGAGTEIIVVGTISNTTYGDGVEVTLNGATTTKNVYGGSLLDSATTVTYDAHVEVESGSYKGLIGGDRIAANVTVEGWSSIKVNSGSAQSVFGGAYVANGGTATITGDTDAVIWGGSFSSFVCGGNVVATGGSATISGDSTLTITGGVFNGAVAGGSDSQGGYISSTSDHTSNLVITGGTFNRIFGGNVASRAEYANFTDTGAGILEETRIDMNGNTSIEIDTTSNVVSISGDIVVGSYGAGQINGNTSVTLTGLGSNLDFTGKLCGDSQNAGAYSSLVTGTRSLTFDNFTGSFGGNIRGIDTVTLSSGSDVFLSTQWYLKYASEWNFSDGTRLSWTDGTNDFSGDTMNLTFNELDSDWTIFTGIRATTANFDDMSVSFNGGASLSYDEVLGGYSDGSYLLSVTNSGDKATSESIIKLAKLA